MHTKFLFVIALLASVLAACGAETKQTASPSPASQEPTSSHSAVVEKTKVEEEKRLQQEAEAKDKLEAEQAKVPGYQIVKSADISVGSNVRFEYYVVPGDKMIDENGVKNIAVDVVAKAKEEHPFNAVVIWLIDDVRAVDIGDPYTIAKIEYAPNGIWINAVTATTGNYKNFDFKYYMGSSGSEKLPKDNPDYPTPQELDIYFSFKKTHKTGEPDSVAQDQVAKQFGITSDDVKKAFIKGFAR